MKPLSIGETFSLVLGGDPVPWARTRGRGGRRFTPKPQRVFKEWLAVEMAGSRGGRAPLEGPVQLELVFAFEAPKDVKRKLEKAGAQSWAWRPRKPDLDNLEKMVLDAGNGVWWKDDAQIVSIQSEKIDALAGYVRIVATNPPLPLDEGPR